jgi:hypothetical protein
MLLKDSLKQNERIKMNPTENTNSHYKNHPRYALTNGNTYFPGHVGLNPTGFYDDKYLNVSGFKSSKYIPYIQVFSYPFRIFYLIYGYSMAEIISYSYCLQSRLFPPKYTNYEGIQATDYMTSRSLKA